MRKKLSVLVQEQKAELTQRTSRLLAVLEGTNTGTWEWNIQTGETRFNELWANLIGYSLDELQPLSIDTWTRFAHPEDLKRSNSDLEQYFAGRTDYYECEVRMKHKDGHWVWVQDRGTVLSYTESGDPEWMYGTHRDISERIQTSRQLQQSEENFRAFFNTSMDYLWVLNSQGEILDINNTVLDNLGYTREELVGRHILFVYPEDRREEASRIIEQMLLGKKDSCLVPLKTKTGRLIPVETKVSLAAWNGEKAVFGVSRDISALAFSEEKYSKMFSTSPALISLSLLETGEFVDVNESFCRTMGYSREELMGQTSTEIVKMDDELRERLLIKMKQQGHIRNEEAVITDRQGTPVEVLLSGEMIDIQGEQYNFSTAIDISIRKRTERELRRALEEQKMLLHELNHRVKNNLMMVGSLITLKDAELGGTADLTDLISRVQAITALHQQLQNSANVSTLLLGPYIRQVIFTAVHNFSRKVVIQFNVTDLTVNTGTAVTLGLIINELATNAVKYGFPENPKPEISLDITAENNTCVIVLSNNGPAVPEIISLENSSTLGLKLVSTMIKQVNGSIEMQRAPHPVFTLTVPINP